MQFLLIAFLVIFAYSCGVNQLYWYYADKRNEECKLCLAEVELDDSRDSKECDCDQSLAK